MRLTMTVSRIIMADWTSKMKRVFEDAGMRLYLGSSYVDDVRIVIQKISPGWDYDVITGKLIFNAALVNDHEMEDREHSSSRTRTLLLKIFNNLNRDLNFTLELPEDFEDLWLPTLDTSLRLENGKISYRYYEKSMSTQYCMRRSSALSWNCKVASLTQEVIRRLLNTHQEILTSSRDQILENFWRKLRISGYSQSESLKIIKDGLMGFERLKIRSEGRIHRDMSTGRMGRILKKISGKSNGKIPNKSER